MSVWPLTPATTIWSRSPSSLSVRSTSRIPTSRRAARFRSSRSFSRNRSSQSTIRRRPWSSRSRIRSRSRASGRLFPWIARISSRTSRITFSDGRLRPRPMRGSMPSIWTVAFRFTSIFALWLFVRIVRVRWRGSTAFLRSVVRIIADVWIRPWRFVLWFFEWFIYWRRVVVLLVFWIWKVTEFQSLFCEVTFDFVETNCYH